MPAHPTPTLAARRDSLLPGIEAPQFTSGPGAKARVLTTAMRLFYYEGIRSVGVDRLIAESSVTKATFYKHYRSKDTLILNYLAEIHSQSVTLVERVVAEAATPAAALHDLLSLIEGEVQSNGFRGCTFINAAIEFADPRHPVRVQVYAHRDWYTATLAELFRAAGHSLPGDAADEFVLLRDGAMTGAYVGDPIATSAALARFNKRLTTHLAA